MVFHKFFSHFLIFSGSMSKGNGGYLKKNTYVRQTVNVGHLCTRRECKVFERFLHTCTKWVAPWKSCMVWGKCFVINSNWSFSIVPVANLLHWLVFLKLWINCLFSTLYRFEMLPLCVNIYAGLKNRLIVTFL